ncbi:MAG: ROK family protein [Pirellulales bacterium]|nr:ROK family protein [Pirellulales bacterium]
MSPAARPTVSRTDSQLPLFVGVDLGGTNIKIGLVDDLGRTLSYSIVPTAVTDGPEAGAAKTGRLVRKMIEDAGVQASDVKRLGLGTPGLMDIPAGMLVNPFNLPGWDDFPIRDRVAHHAGLPVTFANDAAAAAYGEYWVGSGRGCKSMILLTLGTGLGGGIIVNEFSIDGEHSHGAECGHLIIDYRDDARVCGCGGTGHLEAYVSATAVVKRASEALETCANSSVVVRLKEGGELTPKLLAEEAEAGDVFALELIMETAMYLGIGITSLMHTIDPSGVVLGGAMTFGGHNSSLGRRFLERIREEVRRRAFPIPAQQTTIDYASLASDAGYIGAAGLARAEYRRQ